MKRLLLTCFAVGIFAMAMALTSFSKVFQEKYKVQKGSALEKASCTVCHATMKGGKLNLYGKDIETAMKAASSTKVTPAILAKVENLDSNKNGKKNIDDIKADKNPGAQ